MINKVALIGNLGKDPELRILEAGAKYLRFSLATNENYQDKSGEWQTKTEWHNVVLWGAAAERYAKTLRKGMLAYVEGKITYREWKDQGEKKQMTEIRARLVRKLERNDVERQTAPTQTKSQSNDTASDDLPF